MAQVTNATQQRSIDTINADLTFNEENNIDDMYLTFAVAGEEYAVGIGFVTEIVGMQKVMEVPDVPHFIRGVINLRGKVIPVMDVRRRFGMPETTYTERTVIIVLDINAVPIGLVVDAVSEVLEIPESQIDQPPKFGANRDGKGVIRGLGKQGERVAILIDIDRLVSGKPSIPATARRNKRGGLIPMRVLIYNQKGGCGKTTTAINLGAAMARLGDAAVTLVDLDPQTHLTAALGRGVDGSAWTVTQWLAGAPGSALSVSERLFLVPGDCEAQEPRTFANPLAGMDGIVLIDAPPVWSPTVARLMAECDVVLTPLEPDFLGMQGFNRLLHTMKNHGVPWSRLRILICRYVDRLAIHREVRERLGQLFRNGTLLPLVIRNSVRLARRPVRVANFRSRAQQLGRRRLRGGGAAAVAGMAMATSAQRTAVRSARLETEEWADDDEESAGEAVRRAAAK